jgi:hypothetical protein
MQPRSDRCEIDSQIIGTRPDGLIAAVGSVRIADLYAEP